MTQRARNSQASAPFPPAVAPRALHVVRARMPGDRRRSRFPFAAVRDVAHAIVRDSSCHALRGLENTYRRGQLTARPTGFVKSFTNPELFGREYTSSLYRSHR